MRFAVPNAYHRGRGAHLQGFMNDYQQIQNLISRYCFVVDRGSAEEIAAMFWNDATLRFGRRSRNEGAEGIRAGLRKWIGKMRDPVVGLRHLAHAPAIEIEGNRATAETYYDADGHSRKRRRPIHLRGVYRDRLEKRGGEWRFAERHIVIMESTLDDLPEQGQEQEQGGRAG